MSYKRIFFDNPTSLLDQYSEYVEEDRLDRTEYGVWRTLKKYFMSAELEDCQVGFEYDEDGNILMGKSKRDIGNYDPLIVEGIYTDDGRFGTFIADFLDGVDSPWKTTGPAFVSRKESIKKYGAIPAENLAAVKVNGDPIDINSGTMYIKDNDTWKAIFDTNNKNK